MDVTTQRPPWLLLVFSLPSSRASQRVEVWRKLQRFGTLPLRSSGHVLPNTPANQERMEWLAASIRNYKGHASVVQVLVIDDLPDERLRELFARARSDDYERLLREVSKLLDLPRSRRPSRQLNRVRKRFQEIAAIDFFSNPLRARVEVALARADQADAFPRKAKAKASAYRNRLWVTRPRPGIDRVSSAWLIRRFVDPRARFVFADVPDAQPEAIPFDMFCAEGFGHRGDDCTFETLIKEFSIKDRKARRIGQMVHDADLGDEKFGRPEALGLDQVLMGWAQQGVSDEELLRRGTELIEALYEGCR